MDKELATWRLGGTSEQAARWIGISSEVYRLWPERLHPVMVDRVYAAIIRRETARAMGMTARQFFADYRGETVIESLLQRVSLAAVMAHMLVRVPPEFAQTEVDPQLLALEDEPKRSRRRKGEQEAGAAAVG